MNWLKTDVKKRIIFGFNIEVVMPTKNGFLYILVLFFKTEFSILKVNIWKLKYIKNTIDQIRENNEDQDFFSAIKICKKKRIGPARIEDNRSLFYKKDISLLARNGFDFETSKKVMEIEKDDFIKIVKLL